VAWFGDPRGALYRPGPRSEGSGKEEQRPAGELSRWLLMAPFRVGEEMGEGEIEGEGRGWGSSAISGGVEGRGRRADVIPRSEIAGTKPPYVCPGCFIHTYSNNMINKFHVQ
jgi:hypothetical protein